ncbi:MAG: Deacetylase [Desulfovibrio sp.]
MSLFAYDPTAGREVILTRGTVVDPCNGYPENAAIVIRGGTIRAICGIEEAAAAFPAAEVVDLQGRYVSAGFIDMHAHVAGGIGLPPDDIGVRAGVATLLDCGSAGADTLEELAATVSASETEVFALLHIARGGISRDLREAVSLAGLDVDAALSAVNSAATAFPGFIRGMKVRIDTPVIGENSLIPAIRAKKAACRAGLPLMIHIANEPPLLQDMLELLDAGDMVAHCFNGRTTKIVDDTGTIRPCVLAARERGVFFDVAHGGGSFSVDVARAAGKAGFVPDTISSDLHALSRDKNVFSLAVTMSKFFTLGYGLTEIVRLVTASPAHIMGLESSHGRLEPGRKADLTIFSLRRGAFAFCDSHQKTFTGNTLIVPEFTVKAGKPFVCDPPPALPELQ